MKSALTLLYGNDYIFDYIDKFEKPDLFKKLDDNKDISVILVDMYADGESPGSKSVPAGMRLLNNLSESLKKEDGWQKYNDKLLIYVMSQELDISIKQQSFLLKTRYMDKDELMDEQKKPLLDIWEESQTNRTLGLIPRHLRKSDFIYDPNNPEMNAIFDNVRKVTKFNDVPILIRGDTGSGKELLAKAIWEDIEKQGCNIIGKNFRAINISAIEPNSLHATLFGYLKGAYTGAGPTGKSGIFQDAHQQDGGTTLFLDEIGDAPLDVQIALLRVIQRGGKGEIVPLGANRPCFVGRDGHGTGDGKVNNLRLIFATHRDLEGLITKEKFREDFFHRINVFPIRLPPLKKRREEIPIIAEHFRIEFNKDYKMDLKFPEDYSNFMKTLKEYDWPGNIRELEHGLLRSFIISSERHDKTIQLANDVEDKLMKRQQTICSNIQDLDLLFDELPKNPRPLSDLKKYGEDIAVKLGKMLISKSNNSWPGSADTEKYFALKANTFKKWLNERGVTLKNIKNTSKQNNLY